MRMHARTAVTGTLIVGCAAALVAEWPGTYVYDSFVQLREAREGVFSFWHPPVMGWLMGLADRLIPGAALYAAVQILFGFSALIALARLPKRTSWAAVAAAAAICVLPQFLMYQGFVIKDVLFADAVLGAFVALGWAGRVWSSRGLRAGLLLLTTIFLTVAVLARQNGVLFLPFAGAVLAGLCVQGGTGWRKGVFAGCGLIAVVVAGAYAGDVAFGYYRGGAKAVTDQFKTLHMYDIAAVTAARPQTPWPILSAEAPQLNAALRQNLSRYTPGRNDTLSDRDDIADALEIARPDTLTRQWRQIVQTHPLDWLAARGEIFAWMFWPTHLRACQPFFVGANGDPEDMESLGLAPRFDAKDHRLLKYGTAFVKAGLSFWHPLYALIAFIAMVFCIRRRRPEDLAIAGLTGGALCFTASFFTIAIACDYRYLYALDVSALAALLYLAADVRGIRR